MIIGAKVPEEAKWKKSSTENEERDRKGWTHFYPTEPWRDLGLRNIRYEGEQECDVLWKQRCELKYLICIISASVSKILLNY